MGFIYRELLNDVRSLTFLVEGESELLHTVKEKLKEIRAMLKGSIKTDENCCWSHTKQKIEKEKLT